MKINDMTNLFVATNNAENFSILVCATDKIQAASVAMGYFRDSGFTGFNEVKEFRDIDTQIDCDYIVTAHD